MGRDKSIRRSPPGATATGVLALLLLMCLAECVSEQRIKNRGSKSSNLIEKVNGWRSQRGGSCLSYGHSCWGAHGKRSGPSVQASDWFVKKLFGRFDANDELDPARNDDISDMYYDNPELAEIRAQQIRNEETANYIRQSSPEARYIGAKPMVDVDDPNKLSEMKLFQLLRDASAERKS